MFKSIILDNGAQAQAIVAFIVTASVFSLIMLRALKMRNEDLEDKASLPLHKDSETS